MSAVKLALKAVALPFVLLVLFALNGRRTGAVVDVLIGGLEP